MKKILSLFALLLTIVIGAKAASVNDLVPISSDWTFIADDITSNGTTKTAANTLYCDGKIISTTGNSVSTKKGNSTIGGASHLNSLRIKNTQDQLTFKVAGACTVKFYTQSHDSRGIQAGSTAGGTEYGTQDVSTTTWELELDDAATVYLSSFGGDFYIAGFEVTMAEQKEISSQTLAGVKVGETSLTQDATTAGFSVSGTTITLTDDQASAGTPDNVKLVNHITYTDSSTKDEDVDVTFDGTVTSGYFVGEATIGLTGYTVKVKKDVTPTLMLSAASADVTLKSYEVVKANGKNLDPVKVTLTGANLTDGEYNVSASGLTISPASFTVADGAVNQEFSINTTSTTAASTEINFTVGELTKTFTLNLTRPAKRSVTQSVVTAPITWDWANASSEEIQLTKTDKDSYQFTTDPARDDDFLMATLPEVNNNADFNSQALILNTQYVKRSGNYFQGSSVKFKTTLSGKYSVTVFFANTSDRDDTPGNRRYLYIDGTNTNVYTLKQSFKAATATLDLDGTEKEIIINAYTGAETPAATMVRISKIFLAPATLTLNDGGASFTKGFTTFCSPVNFTVSEGATAYKAAIADSKLTMTALEGIIPANTGVVIAGSKNANVTIATTTDDATADVEDNDLKGTTAVAKTADLKGSAAKFLAFKKSTSTFTPYGGTDFPANKAYLLLDSNNNSQSLEMVFEEATGINVVNASETEAQAAPVKVIKNGKLYIGNYNVAGQLVK